MKKYWFGMLSVLLMLFQLSMLSVSAGEIQIYDEGNRLQAEEFTDIAERLQQCADSTEMNIIIILGTENRSDMIIESLADSTYDQLYGNKTDGLCYYLDLSGSSPYDYLSTSGLAQFYYTNAQNNNRINQIYSAVDKYLYPVGSEDVWGALHEFADQLDLFYEAGIPEQYYIYDDVYHEYYHVEDGKIITTQNKPYISTKNILMGTVLGLLIGIIIAAIFSTVTKSRYRFISSVSPTNYLNKKSVRYTEQSDRFIRERTTKTHISQSSGGSHGHHSGGGHSHGGHGGGGHHR